MATPNSNFQQTEQLLADLRALRHFSGAPEKFWDEYLKAAARLALASKALLLTADGQGALLRIRGRTVWQFRCRGGRLSIEDSLWIDGDARLRETSQLVGFQTMVTAEAGAADKAMAAAASA